jgi:acetyl-CoA carboxylase beta subunit
VFRESGGETTNKQRTMEQQGRAAAEGGEAKKEAREELFAEVCSTDFLEFNFNGRAYRDQIADSVAKTKELAGVKVELITLPGVHGDLQIVWVTHSFGFLGGSLGCAEGEKVCRAFEYAREKKLPICIQCRTGGARMQEGTQSLMQMAKVLTLLDFALRSF